MDIVAPNGSKKADKDGWCVINKAAPLDLVRSAMQLSTMLHVPRIVAPYGADRQLAFMAQCGPVGAVCTCVYDLISLYMPTRRVPLLDSAGGGRRRLLHPCYLSLGHFWGPVSVGL